MRFDVLRYKLINPALDPVARFPEFKYRAVHAATGTGLSPELTRRFPL